MKNLLKNRKGLSPVIATVILVSVTIVVAIAVSYWMGSIAGLYTRFEKIEISACYAVKDPATGVYTVTVNLKNSGSQDASITYVLVNGKPSEQYLAQATVTGEAVGTGDGATKTFSLDYKPVTTGSEKIYVAGVLKAKPAEYSIDYTTGVITFVTAPAIGEAITADYTYQTTRQITVTWSTTEPVATGTLPEESMTIPLGKSGTIILTIAGGLYDPGTTLDLKIHSAAGKDYPQMISLP